MPDYLSAIQLVPISLDSKLNKQFETIPDCIETLRMSIAFYQRVGYIAPWIGYFVKFNREFVGSAGFKGPPKDNKVEIAYGTFPEFEGKGIGTAICGQLVLLASGADPEIKIRARTFLEENASTSILKKNGFVLLGTVWDDEDGNVWEWEYRGYQNSQKNY